MHSFCTFFQWNKEENEKTNETLTFNTDLVKHISQKKMMERSHHPTIGSLVSLEPLGYNHSSFDIQGAFLLNQDSAWEVTIHAVTSETGFGAVMLSCNTNSPEKPMKS